MKRALIAAVALFATVSFSGMVLAADAQKASEPTATAPAEKAAEPTKAEGVKAEKKTEKKAKKKAWKKKKAVKKEEKHGGDADTTITGSSTKEGKAEMKKYTHEGLEKR